MVIKTKRSCKRTRIIYSNKRQGQSWLSLTAQFLKRHERDHIHCRLKFLAIDMKVHLSASNVTFFLSFYLSDRLIQNVC